MLAQQQPQSRWTAFVSTGRAFGAFPGVSRPFFAGGRAPDEAMGDCRSSVGLVYRGTDRLWRLVDL